MFAMRTGVLLSLLLAAICLTSVAFAQTSWWRTYGGTSADEGHSVQQTTDGGYIIVGYTQSLGAGNRDVYLIKTNASGDTLWTRTYGGTSDDGGASVQQTSDGGCVVAGYTESFGGGSRDVYLIKANASGDTLWARTYGGTGYDEGTSVQLTTDGGFIMTGLTYSFGAGNCAVYLIKTNAQGDTLRTRTYGPSADWGNSVQQTTDGGYIIAGGSYYDVYLVKTNASGDTLWTRTYGVPYYNEGYSVQQTSDGGYVVAGYTESNAWLIKTDASGDTVWTRTYGGTNEDVGNSVQQTTDGGYIVVGYTQSFGAGNNDVYLIKTNAQGDTLWTRTYGGTSADEGLSVQETADGGYIITGYTDTYGAGGDDVYLVKTDSLGNVAVAETPRAEMKTAEPPPTVVRSLPQGAAAFDAMGRQTRNPKPGIYFVRTAATAAPRKVLLVE